MISLQDQPTSHAGLERKLEVVVVLSSLVTVPLTIAQVRGVDHPLIVFLDWLIWGAFFTEFVVLLAMSSDRPDYLRQNWFGAGIVILTFPPLL